MSDVSREMIDFLVKHLESLKEDLEGDLLLDNASIRITAIPDALTKIVNVTNKNYLSEYYDYFESLGVFYKQCKDVIFLDTNLQQAYDSIILLMTCLKQINEKIEQDQGECVCCGRQVNYLPLSDYYSEMAKKFGRIENDKAETLNKDKYTCPVCGSSDRDRLIVSFLKKINLPTASEGTRILQIAPSSVIDLWIKNWCPNVDYDTTDLYMDGVTFKSDIQNMNNVDSEKYDVIICSHVLEHVQDDMKAMAEMKRILKEDGIIVFLVPIDLNRDNIDEEWGLSEEENWRRFGQNDHCRAYSKQGLIERLSEYFYVNQLGYEYFGEKVFHNCGLTDTSILYVLTKSEKVKLVKGWTPKIDQNLCHNGPLVSVILPCYNHEKYVARAIESIINQSYKKIELIVCDDGSSDNTPIVMKKYSEYFAKEYYFNENLRGREIFLSEQATGKYIAFAHSDDYWEKDKLALQVEYLEKNDGICLTWAEYVDDDGKIQENSIFYKKNRSKEDWIRYFWQYGNCLCNPSSMMRKELFMRKQRYGFASKQLPDYFKWIDLVQHNDIYIIPLPLTKMGIHYSGENINDSAPTRENNLRAMLEDGIHWMYVLEDMDDELFIKVFSEYFRKSDAKTKEELMCEKFFLMRDSSSVARANSAIYYMAKNYSKIQECLRDEYGYQKADFFNDEVQKGFLSLIERK